MRLTVEIELNYPGIEDSESLDVVQHLLDRILERGSGTINDENQFDNEEDECTCTGIIVRKLLNNVSIFYYKKIKLRKFEMPSMAQYDDLKAIPGINIDDVTYEQFCKISEDAWTEQKRMGYGISVQSKFVEYRDQAHLDEIKAELRKEDDFIGFPEDPLIENLIKPIV